MNINTLSVQNNYQWLIHGCIEGTQLQRKKIQESTNFLEERCKTELTLTIRQKDHPSWWRLTCHSQPLTHLSKYQITVDCYKLILTPFLYIHEQIFTWIANCIAPTESTKPISPFSILFKLVSNSCSYN